MAKKTTITFDTAGGMKIEATGYVGKQCAETTEKLIGSLKSKVVAEEKKPEYLMSAGGAKIGTPLPAKW